MSHTMYHYLIKTLSQVSHFNKLNYSSMQVLFMQYSTDKACFWEVGTQLEN